MNSYVDAPKCCGLWLICSYITAACATTVYLSALDTTVLPDFSSDTRSKSDSLCSGSKRDESSTTFKQVKKTTTTSVATFSQHQILTISYSSGVINKSSKAHEFNEQYYNRSICTCPSSTMSCNNNNNNIQQCYTQYPFEFFLNSASVIIIISSLAPICFVLGIGCCGGVLVFIHCVKTKHKRVITGSLPVQTRKNEAYQIVSLNRRVTLEAATEMNPVYEQVT